MSTLLFSTSLTVLSLALSTVQAGDDVSLLPAVHWDHDKADLQHLIPVDNHNLYFAADGTADPSLEHVFAHLSTTLKHPAVILDHSDYIKSVQCQGPNLVITFTDIEVYDFAQKAWASEKDFILATYTSGCGVSTDQRTFWLIDHLASGPCDTCISATIKEEIAVKEALHEVDLVWGTYKPANSIASRSTWGSKMIKRQSISSSTSPAGNSTNKGTCGAPPSSRIDGFPTARCNSTNFDQELDDAIGYLDFDTANYSQSLRAFAPGLEDLTPGSNAGFGLIQASNSSQLQRRAVVQWFSDKVIKPIANTLQKGAEKLKEVATAVANGVTEAAVKVNEALSLSPPLNLNIPISIAPLKVLNVPSTPFGEAFLVYNNSVSLDKNDPESAKKKFINVYCVQCGVNGSVQLNGRAKWSLVNGLSEATVDMRGDIRARLAIGVDAGYKLEQSFKSKTIKQGIPTLQIPKVIVVGPAIGFAAEAELSVALSGQVLFGVEANIPNFAATLDFKNGSRSTSSGFTPQVEPLFNATAQISASAGIGLPISISVGIDILAIDRKLDASITTKPSLVAELTYASSNRCEIASGACLNGIGAKLEFVNQVYADIAGAFKFYLRRDEKTLGSICKKVGPQPACTKGSTPRRGLPSSSGPGEAQNQDLARRQAPDEPNFPNNITSPQTNATTNDYLYQSLNETVYELLAHPNKTTNGSQIAYSPDTTDFRHIADLSGNDELVADPDGNIYYTTPGNGTFFATVSGIVEGDGAGRFFHYYADTMKTYNVSRLRLSDERHIPRTSDFVAFAPVNYDSNSKTKDVYVAADTIGGIFFAVTCDIQGQPSKAFLVSDVVEGVKRLLDPELRYTVTGGVVQRCYFLPWAAPAGSADAVSAVTSSTTSTSAEVSVTV